MTADRRSRNNGRVSAVDLDIASVPATLNVEERTCRGYCDAREPATTAAADVFRACLRALMAHLDPNGALSPELYSVLHPAAGAPSLFGLGRIAFPGVGPLDVFGYLVWASLGEEFGWRGFALPRLQRRQQALAASLLLGVIWGFWHLPLKIAIGNSVPIFLLFVVTGPLPNSVLMTWIYKNAKSSLFLRSLST